MNSSKVKTLLSASELVQRQSTVKLLQEKL